MSNQSDPSETMKLDAEHAIRLFDSTICSMEYRRQGGDPPWGLKYFHGVSLPGIQVFKDVGVGTRSVARSYQHIEADSVRDFLLCLPLDSRSYVLQAGRQTYCEPGAFRVHSAAKPFSASVAGDDFRKPYSQITARVSGSLLRQDVPTIDEFPNLSMDIGSGAGKIMKALLELTLAEGDALTPSQACDFGSSVVRAIAAVLIEAPELASRTVNMRRFSHERIIETALDFIAGNLSNPALDCASVAAHCQVSETYLHASFAASPIKVGNIIRETRLQKCRAALRNPALRHQAIADIAMSWGFSDSTSFSRCYKGRFGITPRDERNLACVS